MRSATPAKPSALWDHVRTNPQYTVSNFINLRSFGNPQEFVPVWIRNVDGVNDVWDTLTKLIPGAKRRMREREDLEVTGNRTFPGFGDPEGNNCGVFRAHWLRAEFARSRIGWLDLVQVFDLNRLASKNNGSGFEGLTLGYLDAVCGVRYSGKPSGQREHKR